MDHESQERIVHGARMFQLTESWWELALRAVIIYVAFMVLVRLSGKRTVGEFTPFDLIVVILIGEAAQGGLAGSDESVAGSVLLAATLVLLNFVVAVVSSRWKAFDKLTER